MRRTPTKALVGVLVTAALTLGACTTSAPARPTSHAITHEHSRPSLAALSRACASVTREVHRTLESAGGLKLAQRKLPTDVRRTLARVLTAVHARLVGECTASVVRAVQRELRDDVTHTRPVGGKGVPISQTGKQFNNERKTNERNN